VLVIDENADTRDPYAVVLRDWSMPQIDGVMTTWRITQHLTGHHRPKVVDAFLYLNDADLKIKANGLAQAL
jgi:CheY-like chemotaxis protein